MKITKSYLKQLIRETLEEELMSEEYDDDDDDDDDEEAVELPYATGSVGLDVSRAANKEIGTKGHRYKPKPDNPDNKKRSYKKGRFPINMEESLIREIIKKKNLKP